MNIQSAHVISDVVAGAGQTILRAIIAGERSRGWVAAMKNVHTQSTAALMSISEVGTGMSRSHYGDRYRKRVLRQLSTRTEKLGMKLVATEQPI